MYKKIQKIIGIIVMGLLLTACSESDEKVEETDDSETVLEEIIPQARNENRALIESIKNEGFMHVAQKNYHAAKENFSEALALNTTDKELQSLVTLSELSILLEEYQQKNQVYPLKLSEMISQKMTQFIPSDPISGMPYQYETDIYGKNYCLSSKSTNKYQLHAFGNGCENEGAKERLHINSLKQESTQSENFGNELKKGKEWGFGYTAKNGESFYMINGTAFGPYDKIDAQSLIIETGKIAFTFKKNDQWGVYVNGRSYAPFSASSPEIIFFGEKWAFLYQDETGNYYVKTSSRTYGPYVFADSLTASKENWGFRYCNYDVEEYGNIMNRKNTEFKSQCGMIISHHKHGPYINVEDLRITDTNWSAWISDQDGRYVISREEIWGPYPNNAIAQLFSDQNFIVQYEQEAEKYIVVVNGDSSGPYSHPVAEVAFSKDAYAFLGEKDDYAYINYNGKTLGPYAKAGAPSLFGKKIGYWYQSTGGANFVVMTEKTFGPYTIASGVSTGEDTSIFQFMKDNQYFVVHNEKKYGPYQNMKQASVDGKNWGVEVLLNNDPHLLVNGKIYGPYPNPFSFSFLPALQENRTAIVFSDQRWFFLSQEFVSNQDDKSLSKKYQLIINGKTYGPYFHGGSDAYVNPVKWLITNEHWSFWYEDQFQKQHLIVDGENFGPHKQTYNGGPIFEEKDWGYRYKDFNENYYTIINGQQFGPYRFSSPPKFLSE